MIVGDHDMPEWMSSWLGQCYRCTGNPTEEDFARLLKEVDWVMLKKIRI